MFPKENSGLPDPIAEPSPEWSALVAQVIDDGARILRAEAALLEIALREVIEEQTDRLLAGLVFGAIAICGLIFILIAAVLLAHQWVQWWLAFGLSGAGALAIVVIAHYVTSSERKRNRSLAARLDQQPSREPS
jgi:putative superfamily III holin-X